MADLDPRDAILQAHAPAVMVPRYGALPQMEKPGHRFLVAADGVWIEVLRPWLLARVQSGYSEIPMPFGTLEQSAQYAFGVAEIERLQRAFLLDAQAAMPNEFAAWGVYNDLSGELAYRPLLQIEASPGGITFHRPVLQDFEHLAVDLHSHGALPAFFSATDDDDDAGEVKLAMVAGTLDATPTFASRLCLLGVFLEADA